MEDNNAALSKRRASYLHAGWFLLLLNCLAPSQAYALCFSGWVFTAEIPSSPASLCQNQGDSASVDIVVRAKESPGAGACNLIAWSKIPGVEVDLYGGYAEVTQASLDTVVFSDGGVREYRLGILNTSGGPHDGIIEIRYNKEELQPLEDMPIIGIVNVRRRADRFCSGVYMPALSPGALVLLGLALGIAGVCVLVRHTRAG